MKKLSLLIVTALAFCYCSPLAAQDIHFSHIHASPTYLNPAMNGVIGNGDIRFILNAKEQWNSVTNAYKTFNFSTDMKLSNLGRTTTVGMGINMFMDKAGDLNYTTGAVNAAVTVIKALDHESKNLISVGFQGGWMVKSFDYTKMIGFDQEDVTMGLVSSRLNDWDLAAGAAWYYNFSWHSFFYVGAAASHLNQANVSFFNRAHVSGAEPIALFPKYVLHGGGNIRLAKYTSILPSAIFMDQGPHREINTGTYIKYIRSRAYKESDYAIYLGAWMRWYFEKDVSGIDAFQASVRMDIKQTALTFSYDFNVSTLARASRGLGSAEISIIHVLERNGPLNKRNNVVCPAF